MAFELNEDGSLRWIDKTKISKQKILIQDTEPIYEVNFYGLYACNIQTNVVGESIKVVRNGPESFLELDKITSIELSITTVRVNTTDELSYYFNFINEAEALEGYTKIEDAIAGDDIQCTASVITVPFVLSQFDPLTPFAQIKYPAAIFVDDLPPIEVLSKADMITKLNGLSDEFTVTNNSNAWTVNFNYVPYKKEYLPKQIRILPRHIKMSVTGIELFLKMDLFTSSYYLFSDNELLTPIEDTYDLKVDAIHTVRVYFANHNCNYFEVGKAYMINFQHNVPTTIYPANSPNITTFVSTHSQLQNVPEILFNSTALRSVVIKGNSSSLPNFAVYPIRSLEIEDSSINFLQLPYVVEEVKIKNMNITSIVGDYPNLVTIKVVDCGKLLYITLPTSKLREAIFINNAINTFQLNTSFDKMYKLTLTNSDVENIVLSPELIKSLNKIDISYNKSVSLENLTTLLNLIVINNKSEGGTLIMPTDSYEIRGEIEDSISLLKKKGWTVVF